MIYIKQVSFDLTDACISSAIIEMTIAETDKPKDNHLQGGVLMLDTENIIAQVLTGGAALADAVSEEFVLAVTAAYLCGVEAGKLAAQSAA